MTSVLKVLLFPMVFAAVIVSSAYALSAGVSAAIPPLLASVLGFAIVLPLERLWPRVGAAAEPRETLADLGWFALTGVVHPLSGALAASLAAFIASVVPSGMLGGLPLWIAVPVALLVATFGDYWAHRLGHEIPAWWRLHAVHHAPHRMVALNDPRLHPLDTLLKVSAQTLPLLVLGFDAQAIALVGAIQGIQIAFQHGDVDLRHGPISLGIATNAVHRWHHSADPAEANANYGNVLALWDHLFGTYRVPPSHENPARMGLFQEGRYPVHGLVRAIVAPLCWRRCVEAP